ncbi:MAG: hypothetical protein AB7S71_00785 [Dongiaceae bacterium]
MIAIIPAAVRRAYLYDNGHWMHDGDLEGTMMIRRLAAASAEVLVLAIGVAIATPYFLILASPFIGH